MIKQALVSTDILGSGVGGFAELWAKFTEDRSVTKNSLVSRKNTYDQIQAMLKKVLPPDVLQWATAQVMFETNGLQSRLSLEDNNLSGIKFINKPTLQKNAVKGRKSPEGDYYAKFKTQQDWANDFARILSIGQRPPIKATALRDYVARLKNNGYFTGNEDIYFRGLSLIEKVLPTATKLQTQNKADFKDEYNGMLPWYERLEQWAKDHPGMAIGSGLVGLFVIKKMFD